MQVSGGQPGIMADLKVTPFWFGKNFVSYVMVSDMRYILKCLIKKWSTTLIYVWLWTNER